MIAQPFQLAGNYRFYVRVLHHLSFAVVDLARSAASYDGRNLLP